MKSTLADALKDRGYDTLTPVQEAVTAPEVLGADMLVSAQTGSGKTLGFGLAIAPALLGEEETFSTPTVPLALVIAPTRELALQVKRELGWLYAKAGAVVTSCVGGMDMRDERRALARGAHIVVATPGRLRDHIMRGSIELAGLSAIVLDEADEMLDLGFREDLEFILGEAPEERQTLLFSATVPKSIAMLARNYQKDAIRISTRSESSQHADIEYRALTVAERDAEKAIINVLRFFEAPNAIVFCNTRAVVNRMTTRLSNRGFSVVALSGELSQTERTHALQAMRDGRARVCVATDVAARGIDLPNLDLVVHAELPSNHETLLHRSGRTGRAGRKGVSTLIVPPKARKKAERILGMAKVRAVWGPAPGAEEVRAEDEARMLADPVWNDPPEPSDADAVDRLVERFTPRQLATAYLKLHALRHSAPEELADGDAPPRPREDFGPSVWFSISGGRQVNAEPRRILPMLCKMGALGKDDIGAIRVQPSESFVQIRADRVEHFLSAVGPAMTLEAGARLTRLEDAPKIRHARAETPARAKKTDTAPKEGAPTDWNDAPTPRNRKPKPQDRKADRPGRKPGAVKPGGPAKGEGHPPARKGRPSAASKAPWVGDESDRTKGPPPPRGKPNSKKNKARAKLAKVAKKGGKGR